MSNKGRKHMTKEERAECVKLYRDEGVTQEKLADKYDRHITVIFRLIKREGARRGYIRMGQARQENKLF